MGFGCQLVASQTKHQECRTETDKTQEQDDNLWSNKVRNNTPWWLYSANRHFLLTSPHTFIISPPWSFISLSRFLSRSDMQSFHFKIPRSSAKTKWLHIFNNSPVTKNHSKWKILPTIQEQNNVGSYLNAGIYFSDSTVLHQIARI